MRIATVFYRHIPGHADVHVAHRRVCVEQCFDRLDLRRTGDDDLVGATLQLHNHKRLWRDGPTRGLHHVQ